MRNRICFRKHVYLVHRHIILDNSVISINIKIAQNELDTLKFCVDSV